MLEYARDIETNSLIFVNEAIPTLKYICPECGDFVFPKNQCTDKANHFCHYSNSNCTGGGIGESETHKNAKLLVAKALESAIGKRFGFKASKYKAPYYEYNIMRDITEVKVEKKTEDIIPDISLFSNGVLKRAVEIVYRHKDEYKKVLFYREKGIDVIYVHLKFKDDYISMLAGWEMGKVIDNVSITVNTKKKLNLRIY